MVTLNRQLLEQKKQNISFNKQKKQVQDFLKKNNYGNSTQEYNKLLNEIRAKNPQLASQLPAPQSIQNEQLKTFNLRIQNLEKNIKKSREKEKELKKRDKDDRANKEDAKQDGYRAEITQLNRFKKDINNGRIFNIKEALSFADNIGKAERKKETAKARAKQLQKENESKLKDINSIILSGRGKEVINNTLISKDGKKINLGNISTQAVKDAINNFKKADVPNIKVFDSKSSKLVKAFKNNKLVIDNKNINIPKSKINVFEPTSSALSGKTFDELIKDEVKRQKDNQTIQLNSFVNNQLKDIKLKELPKSTFIKILETIYIPINVALPITRPENKDILFNWNKQSNTNKRNLAVDFVASIPTFKSLFSLKSGAAALTRVGSNLKNTKNIFSASKGSTISITNVPKLKDKFKKIDFNKKDFSKFINNYGGSIATNTAFTDSLYRTVQKQYNVDNTYLNNQIKSLKLNELVFLDKNGNTSNFKINNQQKLYNLYNTYIGEETNILNEYKKTGKLKTDANYYYRFIGLDVASKKGMEKAQNSFIQFLKDNGADDKTAKRIVSELENKRRARIISQIGGGIVTEASSEFLARDLIKKGVGKTTAVAIAGAREALSVLSQEAFIQQGDLTVNDFVFAVTLGAAGSVFFSKQSFKSLNKKFKGPAGRKKINKILDKSADSLAKSTTGVREKVVLNKYLSKLKVPKNEIDLIKKSLTQAQKNEIKKRVIRAELEKKSQRSKLTRILKGGVEGSEKLRTKLRGWIANIIEPQEIAGDVIADIRDKLLKNSKIKSQIKRNKIKSLAPSLSKTKPKTKPKPSTKAKTKSKIKPKTKPKPSTKAKTKPKTKPKPSTKTKAKTKPKTKPKPSTKTKTKAKIKPKTKPKTKVKTISFPLIGLPKFPKSKAKNTMAYKIEYIKNGNKFRSVQVLPKNRAIEKGLQILNKNKGVKKVSIQKSTIKTDIKDIKDKTSKKYKINKGKSIISINRK